MQFFKRKSTINTKKSVIMRFMQCHSLKEKKYYLGKNQLLGRK